MSNLQNGALFKLQGVPVENRHDESLEFIKEVHPTNSPSSLSSSSSLKRFLKISNRPLLIARNSATSFYEDEEIRNTNNFPSIFSRRTAPESHQDRTLSFITNRDQSTSKGNPTPQGTPLPVAKPTTAKVSKSFNWNRLFQRQKSKVKSPEQETLEGKGTKEVTVLKLRQEEYNPESETHSANDVEKPSPGASQEPQLPIDPKPELSEPLKTDRPPVATEPEVYRWKRWFNRKKRQSKDKAPEKETLAGKETKEVMVLKLRQEEYNPEPETHSANDVEKPSLGACQEQELPSDPKREVLKPMDTDRSPVATESELFRWKRWFNRHRRQHKNEAPEEVLVQKQNYPESASELKEQRLGVTQENQLPSEPEPERLKPKTPIKRVLLPVATESEVYWKRWFHRRRSQTKVEAPEQKTGETTEEVQELKLHQEQNKLMTQPASDLEEPSLGASQEQQLPSDPEPDRLEPKTPMKNDSISVAAESENVKPHLSASGEVNLPIDPEPERSRPPTREKRFASTSERDDLHVTVESEDVVPNKLASTTPEAEDVESHHSESAVVNLPIDPEPERSRPPTREKRFASTSERDDLHVTVESEDAVPNQLASDTPEPEDIESHHSASGEVNLSIDPEPERLEPKIREKRFARNASEDQIQSTYERDHLSVAAEPENVEPNQPASD